MTLSSRLIVERPLASKRDGKGRAARSVRVNLAESPLRWLYSCGHVSRQLDAAERLPTDWERGQLAPRVTMNWNAAPIMRSRGGSGPEVDLNESQVDTKRWF